MVFVKVDSARGATGLWKVVGQDPAHYNLSHIVTGEQLHIYKAHTSQDAETRQAGQRFRQALVGKFGARAKSGWKPDDYGPRA